MPQHNTDEEMAIYATIVTALDVELDRRLLYRDLHAPRKHEPLRAAAAGLALVLARALDGQDVSPDEAAFATHTLVALIKESKRG